MANHNVEPLKLIAAAALQAMSATDSIGGSNITFPLLMLIDGGKASSIGTLVVNDEKEVAAAFLSSLAIGRVTFMDSGSVSMATNGGVSMVAVGDKGVDDIVNCYISFKKGPPILIQKAPCSPINFFLLKSKFNDNCSAHKALQKSSSSSLSSDSVYRIFLLLYL